MRRTLALVLILIAAPLYAEDTLLERLRANVHEALRESDAPPLHELEEAATDVEALVARVERHVDASVLFLREIGPCGEATPETATAPPMPHEELTTIPDELDRAFADLEAARDDVHKLVTPQSPERFRAAITRALENADDMLARRRDSSIAARWLRRFAEERRRSETHQDLCRLLESVAPLPEPFTIADIKRDPLLPIRRVHERNMREIERRTNALQRGEWSIGAGIEWTPMRVGDETRAGKPIAMLSFRPLAEDLPIFRDATIRPWVQLGAGLEFDEPSFYVGGAFDLGPYALVGVGWTAQDTGDEFDGDVYVSVTVRLERWRMWTGR